MSDNAKRLSQALVNAVHQEPLPPSFTRELEFCDAHCREEPLGQQPNWLLSMDGSERENVCFMDLAKMIIEVCVLVSSQSHSPCSPDRAGLW